MIFSVNLSSTIFLLIAIKPFTTFKLKFEVCIKDMISIFRIQYLAISAYIYLSLSHSLPLSFTIKMFAAKDKQICRRLKLKISFAFSYTNF